MIVVFKQMRGGVWMWLDLRLCQGGRGAPCWDQTSSAEEEIFPKKNRSKFQFPDACPLCLRSWPGKLNSSYIKRPLNLFSDVLSQSLVHISHAQEHQLGNKVIKCFTPGVIRKSIAVPCNDFTRGQNSAVDDKLNMLLFFFSFSFLKLHGVTSYTILFVAHNIIAVISSRVHL